VATVTIASATHIHRQSAQLTYTGALVKQETKRNETAKRPETGSHTQNIDSDCTWVAAYIQSLASNLKGQKSL